jgi:hypothetical protein
MPTQTQKRHGHLKRTPTSESLSRNTESATGRQVGILPIRGPDVMIDEIHVDLSVSLAMESTRSPAACAHRYDQTLKPNIKRGAWSADEDNKLRDAVALHGQKWSRVRNLVLGRTAAQCRERFVRSLTSSTKVGPWTKKVQTGNLVDTH